MILKVLLFCCVSHNRKKTFNEVKQSFYKNQNSMFAGAVKLPLFLTSYRSTNRYKLGK